MSADITGLVVAVVGVAGTLTAPVVTQRLSMRARRQELDAEYRQRVLESDTERRRSEVAERKTAYLSLLVAERSYRRAMRNHLHAPTEQTRDIVEQTRRVFDRAHVQAYLVATDPVLDAVKSLGDALVAVEYQLASTGEDAADHSSKLLTRLDGETRSQVMAVREAMRTEIRAAEDLPRRADAPAQPELRRTGRWRSRERHRG